MRYKTFRSLVLVGAVFGGGALIWTLGSREPKPAEPVPAVEPRPVAAPAAVPEAPGAEAPATAPPAAENALADPADPDALRPMDEEILARVDQNISGDKAKDAVRGRPWKVNLYRDAGQAGVNRLKVDLNRNEKWDEKWTISSEGGVRAVKRQVAPADDESYTVEYRLEGKRWVRK